MGVPGFLSSVEVMRARTDLAFFSEYCFGFVNKPFHVEWYNTISDYSVRSGLIIAPRNSAKSTCWAKVAPLWLLGNNPDLRIVLVSRTSTLAQTNLRFIRQNIESNVRVKEVFPPREIGGRVCGLEKASPWGEEQLTVRNNRMDGAPSVYAVGLEGSITGIRSDLIVVDDLIDINNVMTDSQREKVIDFWNNVVMPTLNPGGRIFIVGTRYHAKDFYSTRFNDPRYKDHTFVFPALAVDERGEYVLGEDGKPISYWPERVTADELLRMKEDMGSLAFNSQYMCDVSGYVGRLFDPEWMRFYDPTRDLNYVWPDLDFVMAVDPNITDSPESDNTAIVTGAVDRRRGQLYVLDMFAKPLDFVSQVKELQRHATRTQVSVGGYRIEREMRISRIGVESVAYQRSLQQSGYLVGLPVVEVKRHNQNKEVRILGVQPHIENGRILFPDPGVVKVPWWEDFYEEYCTFPRGRRDDRMDALETLVSMVVESFGASGIPYGPTDDDALRRNLYNLAGGVLIR